MLQAQLSISTVRDLEDFLITDCFYTGEPLTAAAQVGGGWVFFHVCVGGGAYMGAGRRRDCGFGRRKRWEGRGARGGGAMEGERGGGQAKGMSES
jgi:hypothetical protein